MTRTQIDTEIRLRQEALSIFRQDWVKATTPQAKLVMEGLIEELIEEIHDWKRTPPGVFYDDSESSSLLYY